MLRSLVLTSIICFLPQDPPPQEPPPEEIGGSSEVVSTDDTSEAPEPLEERCCYPHFKGPAQSCWFGTPATHYSATMCNYYDCRPATITGGGCGHQAGSICKPFYKLSFANRPTYTCEPRIYGITGTLWYCVAVACPMGQTGTYTLGENYDECTINSSSNASHNSTRCNQ